MFATVNRFVGESDIAVAYFERSLLVFQLIGNHLPEGVTLVNLSILYCLKEDYSASGHAAESALAFFQGIVDEL